MLFIVALIVLVLFIDWRIAAGLVALTVVGWFITQAQRRGGQ